jgi:post-segregation antitoxin (ccd killing protein)
MREHPDMCKYVSTSVKSKEAMTHMTITVPVELKREMEKRPEINWSRTATKAFEKRIEAEKTLEAFAEPGITEDEAIARGVNLRHKLLDNKTH